MLRLPGYLGFVLGLLGLSISTVVFAVSWGYAAEYFSSSPSFLPMITVLFVLSWICYFFLSLEIYSRSYTYRGFRVGLVVGLIFLAVPVFLVGGFSSAYGGDVRIVSIDRTFSSSLYPSVLIKMTVEVFPRFAYLPVTLSNLEFVLYYFSNSSFGRLGLVTLPDPTALYPLGHASYRIDWNSSSSVAIQTAKRTITGFNLDFGAIFNSGLNQWRLSRSPVICWEWKAGIGIPTSFPYGSASCNWTA